MFFTIVRDHYDALYVSPHLDDVILSCGGQISARTRRGESVLIATLAAGEPAEVISPLAKSLHQGWNLEEGIAARRMEDRAACQRLGAEAWHGDALDCIYRVDARTGRPLYSSLDEVYGAVSPADPAGALFLGLLKLLPAADTVIAPLGVGGHLDHGLARQACETLFGGRIWYYEDFPYASRLFAVGRLTWPRWNWRRTMIALDETDLSARIDASAMYSSQVDMMAGGRDPLERKIRSYVRKAGGERLWRMSR